jgi:hypothetical protein
MDTQNLEVDHASDHASITQTSMNRMGGFEHWLFKQCQRPDNVGVFGREMCSDPDWPAGAGLRKYHQHLEDIEACVEAHVALDIAWKEYNAIR